MWQLMCFRHIVSGTVSGTVSGIIPIAKDTYSTCRTPTGISQKIREYTLDKSTWIDAHV